MPAKASHPKPARLQIPAVLAIKKDPAHEVVPLPQNPNLLRRLDEIERLGIEQQLGRPTRPASGHRAERPAALTDQFIMRAHLRSSPVRQIRVFDIRETLDIPWTYAARPLPTRIGCSFGRLMVEIASRESDAATPVRIRSDRRH
jgi:hypothetical protein